ncbi:MAG: Ig-like domain-containing protein, partial [Candidatus Methylacidiphilales bacterium]
MKNLIKSTLLLLLFVFVNNINAQNACEFEKTFNYREEGKKIIETKKKQFLIASVFGYQTNIFVQETLNLVLTKTDNCGNIIWKTKPDSSLDLNDKITILNLIEEENEDILLIAKYFKFNASKYSYRFIKLDSDGNVKWKKDIGNYFLDKINMVSIEKISENNFMFISIKDTNNQIMYQTLFFDTLSNLKRNNYIDSTSKKININYSFLEVYKQSNTLLTLITNRDTNALKILAIDTFGNVISSVNIVSTKGFGYTWATMNNNKTEYNVFTLYKDAPKRYVAKYSLTGHLLKDTVLIDTLFTKYEFLYINKNYYLLAKQNYLNLVDSNFKIIWKKTISKELTNSGFNYNGVLNIFDSSLVILGAESSSNGNGNLGLRWFIKKVNLINFISNIQILSANSINTQGGLLQLTAAILPTNAANKNIIWSISDTNLATITQTGLVTAKA